MSDRERSDSSSSWFPIKDLIYRNFIGTLACLDGYMNIAMEQTEEFVNEQLTNKYGDTFIRGNNGKL